MTRITKVGMRVAVAAALLPTPTYADPAVDLERMLGHGNQLSEELVTCGAFFIISAVGFQKKGTPKDIEAAEKTKEQANRVLQFAEMIGKSIQQKPEVIGARLEMSMRTLRKEMADNFINYSILLNKYLEPCAELVRDPERTVAERLGVYSKPDEPARKR